MTKEEQIKAIADLLHGLQPPAVLMTWEDVAAALYELGIRYEAGCRMEEK